MPVTMRLFFRAMAEQRHGLIFGEMLQEPQREFLPVILDSLVPAINRPAFPQFAAITAAEFRPGNFGGLKFFSQSLARSQVGHPNVKPVRRQTPPAPTRRENPQAVFPRFDLRVNAFGFEHDPDSDDGSLPQRISPPGIPPKLIACSLPRD